MRLVFVGLLALSVSACGGALPSISPSAVVVGDEAVRATSQTITFRVVDAAGGGYLPGAQVVANGTLAVSSGPHATVSFTVPGDLTSVYVSAQLEGYKL